MTVIKKTGIFALIVSLILILCSCKPFTIVPIEESSTDGNNTISSGEKAVDVTQYVDERWDSVFADEINERRQDLSDLLTKASADGWASIEEEYGVKKGDIGAKFNFIAYDTAIVREVNTESRAGSLLVELEGAPADYPCVISIGPVLKGTALRDSLKSINFNEFVNQMDYANLANELNKRANTQIIENVDIAALGGKAITFTGSFTEPEGTGEILIMPISLEVE
jgi:predicted lipoprotein